MTIYSSEGFTIRELGCKVYATPGFWDYSVAKIENPIQKRHYFRTADEYFKHIIAKIKEDILRNVPDLRYVNIQLHAFDSSNTMHRLILTVAQMLQYMMRIREHINLSRLACIIITYNDIPIFIEGASLQGI